ncbi:hypothetical protein MLD38_016488 [Melastoma candidum]|uniref:Uncharacterized protein n=1 Tax=Melastoma candidum TaxID=119954 RepID=A0ACB9QN57_9MYRT|nr:hypothetical protein MLD38_016488 [Melastoma candidum]
MHLVFNDFGYGGAPMNYDGRIACGQTKVINSTSITATEYVNWDGIHSSSKPVCCLSNSQEKVFRSAFLKNWSSAIDSKDEDSMAMCPLSANILPLPPVEFIVQSCK